MTKRLFDENDKYTPEANTLDNEVSKLLETIFEKWAAEGYSPRDISHLMHHAVIGAELKHMLGRSHP